MNKIFLAFIWLYKRSLSKPLRFLGAECRFYPNCSTYAQHAFESYGFLTAVWLTLRRLSKCGPWHEGGFDPVPPNINRGK